MERRCSVEAQPGAQEDLEFRGGTDASGIALPTRRTAPMLRCFAVALTALLCGCHATPGPSTAVAAWGIGNGPGRALDAGATLGDQPQVAVTLPRSGSREVRTDWPDAVEPASAHSVLAALVLQFDRELAHGEHVRTQQELLPPLFVPASLDLQSPAMLLHSEQQFELEGVEQLAEDGPGALGKPVRGAVRNSDLGLDVQEMLTDLRAARSGAHAPSSGVVDRGVDLGRPGLRVRIDRADDPLELTWRLGGLRAGASLGTARVGFEHTLRRDLCIVGSVRARHDEGELSWRTGLQWRLGSRTRLDALIGTGLDFLPATGLHTHYDSPLDGEGGALVQLVHWF